MPVKILRFRASAALIVLLAPLYVSGQSDPSPWRFVYPNAKALIGIDWQRIRQTPAGAMLRDKWLNARAWPLHSRHRAFRPGGSRGDLIARQRNQQDAGTKRPRRRC
jgi:hypothetical protein